MDIKDEVGEETNLFMTRVSMFFNRKGGYIETHTFVMLLFHSVLYNSVLCVYMFVCVCVCVCGGGGHRIYIVF